MTHDEIKDRARTGTGHRHRHPVAQEPDPRRNCHPTTGAARSSICRDGTPARPVRYDRSPSRPITVTTDPKGHIEGTPAEPATAEVGPQGCDQGKLGGDDGNRTHDPLLAKQVL